MLDPKLLDYGAIIKELDPICMTIPVCWVKDNKLYTTTAMLKVLDNYLCGIPTLKRGPYIAQVVEILESLGYIRA